jgi:TPR repeat protein
MPSDAQKRAANKYIKEHMTTLGCKVKKEEAAAFKAYAAEQGKTSNTILKEYVLRCISEK